MLTDTQADGFRQTGVLALPQLFAFEEIGWLREVAVGLAQRHGAVRGAGRFAPVSLHDVHLVEPSFRKLALHPRLTGPIARLLDGEPALRGTRLCIGTGFDILANAPDEISAVVFLDVTGGSDSRLGSALLVDGAAHYRDPRLSPNTLAFVATFARKQPVTAGDEPTEERDDSLWPPPHVAMG
jgi:hypothetical protein